jgi:hypothetical protein
VAAPVVVVPGIGESGAGAEERDRAESGQRLAQLRLRADKNGSELVDRLGASLVR